jgi:curli biogenesis system outer membrane secretion channel CsgG
MWFACAGVLAIALVTFAGAPLAAQGKASRPTVALLDFDFGTVQQWWSGNWDIGKGISDMIVDPSAATVAKLGKVLGVKYLIVGSITKFGMEQKKQGIGGGGWDGGGFGIGKVGREKGKANVAITARVIDISTAEIMASAKGEGTSSRSGLLLGGGGGGWGGGGMGEIDMSSSDYRETVLGEATELAVKQVTEKIVAAKTRLE